MNVWVAYERQRPIGWEVSAFWIMEFLELQAEEFGTDLRGFFFLENCIRFAQKLH